MRRFWEARKYPATLACISAGILIFGMLLKPERAAAPKPVISQFETARLQQLAQKNSLQNMAVFIANVAQDASEHLAFLPETRTTGVVWDSRGAVVAAGIRGPVGSQVAVLLPSGVEAQARIRPAASPVSLLRVPADSSLSPAPADRGTGPGSWVVQVSRQTDGSLVFTPGTYRGIRQARCGAEDSREADSSIHLTEVMEGGGVFNLDGELIAVVVPCGTGRIALPAQDVAKALGYHESRADAVARQYGVRFEPLDRAARDYFKTDAGLLVREIQDGSAAARAGLRPGDIVTAINGQAVDEVDAFLPRPPTPDEAAVLTVRRRGRLVTLPWVSPGPAAADETPPASSGVVVQAPPEGYPVETVEPDSPAARAGLMPGDRLLDVNGVPVRAYRDATRLLGPSAPGPKYVTVVRGDRRVGVLLP